jgi:hypothetical protein
MLIDRHVRLDEYAGRAGGSEESRSMLGQLASLFQAAASAPEPDDTESGDDDH